MKLGIVGLGKMGMAIVHRVLQAGHEVVGFDINQQARKAVMNMGAEVVESVSILAQKTKIIWIMVPAGKLVDDVIHEILPKVHSDAIIIDGGNSHFSDSIRRYNQFKEQKISFVDCGVSGGLKGREIGFSLMVGGDKIVFERIEPLLQAIAAPNGCDYMGPAGAGHYVKMVHNGIEYALLQGFAEGMHLLREKNH